MRQIIKVFERFRPKFFSVMQPTNIRMEDALKRIFYASVNSVKPSELITKNKLLRLIDENSQQYIEINQRNSLRKFDVTNKNIHLVGFGKGVLAITAELESVLEGKLASGILSVPVGALAIQKLREQSKVIILEGAAFNIPDEAARRAATAIKHRALQLTNDDVLLVLITGGGSALLPLPIEPITLQEKSNLIKQLSRAGATIKELNNVRIAISQVKGGKLAVMAKNANQIISLIISDVIGDPFDLIASGPTISHQKPTQSPLEVLEKFNLWNTLPDSIAQVLRKNEENQDIPPINNSDVFLIGNNRVAIEAAMEKARSFNLIPVFLSSEVQGNVVDVSQAYLELALAAKRFASTPRDEFCEKIARIAKTLSAQASFVNDLVAALEAGTAGICIISGGETTVTVTGDGLGGRNQELALRFTKLCLDANTSSLDDLLLLSAGTDGLDGNNDAAGALGGPSILSGFAEPSNISGIMQDFIFRNDSYRFYKNVVASYAGDRYQIMIGHTGTNVMDIHLLMIMPNTQSN